MSGLELGWVLGVGAAWLFGYAFEKLNRGKS